MPRPGTGTRLLTLIGVVTTVNACGGLAFFNERDMCSGPYCAIGCTQDPECPSQSRCVVGHCSVTGGDSGGGWYDGGRPQADWDRWPDGRPLGDDRGSSDSGPGDDILPPGDWACATPCGTDCCGSNQDCFQDRCVPACATDHCGASGACCPSEQPTCIYGRFCEAPCPVAGGPACGPAGDVCCAAHEVCGPTLSCIADCSPTETLCGNGTLASYGTTCCTATDLCVFDQCVTPGDVCQSFLDCDLSGEYCELTLDPPRCVPNVFPPDVPVCQHPSTDLFLPEIEWHFLGVIDNPVGSKTGWRLCEEVGDYGDATCYKNVETAPMVADLDKATSQTDLVYQSPWAASAVTYPAGKLYPEVVVKAYRTSNFDDNVIVVLDGRNGSLERAIPNETRGHVALANLDGDRELEIVAAHAPGVFAYDPFYVAPASGGTVCPTLDANGACEVRWSNATGSLNHNWRAGAPTVTDLNDDGRPEVVMAGVVLDGMTGVTLLDPGEAHIGGGTESLATPEHFYMASVADVNLDGIPEVLVGNEAFQAWDGAHWSYHPVWSTTDIGNGYVGVGNFVDNTQPPYVNDPDVTNYPHDKDYPEVVVIKDGVVVFLHGATGKVMKSPVDGVTPLRLNLFTRKGGPPNIADFDGDGRAEVSFAGSGCMVVLDPYCMVGDTDGNGDGGRGERAALAAQAHSGCATDPTTLTYCTVDVAAGISNHNAIGILWMSPTQDQSSAVTGTSVFDFQGDGKAEVLYNDECFFRVFDGPSGKILMERPNSHRTGTEYPIVVDVDGDSNSEILHVATNDMAVSRDTCAGAGGAYSTGQEKGPIPLTLYKPEYCTCGHLKTHDPCTYTPGCRWNVGAAACEVDPTNTRPDTPAKICQVGTWGVWAIGDTQKLWVKTLPQWHEHTYHVTEVDLSGKPRADWGAGKNNWDVYNNYRQNVQGYVPLNAPDLAVVSFDANAVQCPPLVTLVARIVNQGRAGIPAGEPMRFYLLDPPQPPTLIAEVPLPYRLLPGQGADIEADYDTLGLAGVFQFGVSVNPDDWSNAGSPSFECNGTNNSASVAGVICDRGEH